MMPAAAFIIHLERATARKAQVAELARTLPLPAHVIAAVDGAELSPKKLQSVLPTITHRPAYPFPLSQAEVGCFLSHRNVWQEIVARDLDFGLIVEDDIVLDPDVFPSAFELAAGHIHECGFVRFPWFDKEAAKEVLATDGEQRLILPRAVGLGMLAQLVSKKTASHLLKVTKTFDRPVDTLLQMPWITGVQPYSVCPSGVAEISSQLGGSTIGKKHTGAQKLLREIRRPIYRAKIAYRSKFHHGNG